jgi:hypothetical protein
LRPRQVVDERPDVTAFGDTRARRNPPTEPPTKRALPHQLPRPLTRSTGCLARQARQCTFYAHIITIICPNFDIILPLTMQGPVANSQFL